MTCYMNALAFAVVVWLGSMLGCGGVASNVVKSNDPAPNANSTTPASVSTPTSNSNSERTEAPRNAPVRSPDNKGAAETRCGWFSNPTPGNAWLIDRDGEWTIGNQGGFQASGDWPDFADDQWVKTNINYGYGCACMSVTVDRSTKKVIKILTANAKSLLTCRNDGAIRSKEPKVN